MRTGCLIAPLLALAASVCTAQDDYPVHVYPCAKAVATPRLDGVLDDACWKNAPLVSGFTFYDEPKLAPVQTSFRAAYDRQCLYFGVVCDEPLAQELAPLRTARDDGQVFHHEALEFFVDPAHDHELYYQFAVSAAGGLYDSRVKDASWNSGATAKVRIGDTEWSLELAIPWADLEVSPRPGTVLGFNVCRDREVGGPRQWTNWSQTKANFHDPMRFAHLVLSPTAEQLGQLGEEFRKGHRTGPLRIYGPGGFSETPYRALAQQALADLDALLAQLEDARRQERDAAAARELGKRIEAYRPQVAQYRAQIEGKRGIDAATWVRMELAMRQLTNTLRGAIWDARLAALLSRI